MIVNPWIEHLVAVPLGLWIAYVGVLHFRDPAWFEPIVPPILGNPRFWVLVSGGFEIVLGLGMVIPAWREPVAFGMTVLMVALYWANLHMWVNDVPLNGRTYATIWHVLRGLAQATLIAVCLWLGGWATGQRLIAGLQARLN